MSKIFIVAALTLLAACATTPSAYDRQFGDTVRDAKQKMTTNPNAGKTGGSVAGMDGKAAQEILTRYHASFKTPPAVANVINIGGAVGGGGGGGN